MLSRSILNYFFFLAIPILCILINAIRFVRHERRGWPAWIFISLAAGNIFILRRYFILLRFSQFGNLDAIASIMPVEFQWLSVFSVINIGLNFMLLVLYLHSGRGEE